MFRLGLILRGVNGERVCDVAKHGFRHIDILRARKLLNNSGGKKRNSEFRATIDHVALIENVKD